MISLDDMIAAMNDGKEAIIPVEKPKVRKFVERRYDVVAYRLNGEQTTLSNITIKDARNSKVELKRNGFYRVDIIEVETLVNEPNGKDFIQKELTFGKPVFEKRPVFLNSMVGDRKPVKAFPSPIDGFVRKSIVEARYGVVISKDDNRDAFLYNRPIVKVSDRNAKVRVERKRSEATAKKNEKNATGNDLNKVMIYDKLIASNPLIFVGTQHEAMAFIINNKIKVSNVTMYVNGNTYRMLEGK